MTTPTQVQVAGLQWSATQVIFQTTISSMVVSMDEANSGVTVSIPANGGPISISGDKNPMTLGVGEPQKTFAGDVTVSFYQPQVTPATHPTLIWRKQGLPNSSTSAGLIVASSVPAATGTPREGSQTTSITPSQTKNPQPGPSPGISTGAIAGIAIGCLLAGALISGTILFFCWKKRKVSPVRDHEASKIALMPQEKGFSVNTASIGSSNLGGSPGAGVIPLPLEDKAISGEISKISNLIKNHVQSYYHTGRVSQGLIDFDDVQALGSSMPVPVGTLSMLLSNATTREIALRFCIAWVACSRMLLGTSSSVSLLPPEVAGCSRSISQMPKASPSNAALQARWRSSTAELLQSTYIRNAFAASDSRNESIQETIRALDNVLQPYADSRMDNEQRKRNLEEILKRCASFAFTLFSQPSTWDFDWQVEQGGKSGELCVFPALVQVTDDHGEAVQPPRPFSEAVVRKLEG